MANWPPLVGIRIGGGGLMVVVSLTTPLRMAVTLIINRNPGTTRTADEWKGNYR